MLRADLFTLSAFDTVGSLAVTAACYHIVVVITCVPVMERFMGVERREQVRNTDAFGTFILFTQRIAPAK